MTPEEAQAKYDEEWPILDKEFQLLKLTDDRPLIKQMRQKLTALSLKYRARYEEIELHDYLEGDPLTQEEEIQEFFEG